MTSWPIDPKLIVTTDTIPGYHVIAALGVAEGYALRIFPVLTLTGQRDVFNALMSEATLDMMRSARDHDAQGIVGLRYVALTEGGLMVYGTAVSIRRVDQTSISVSGPSIRQ